MKKFFVVLIIAVVAMIGCKKEKEQKVNQDSTVTNVAIYDSDSIVEDTAKVSSDTSKTKQLEMGKEYTSRYICPMHCKGSGSDKPGTCPVCGMEYIKNPDYQQK